MRKRILSGGAVVTLLFVLSCTDQQQPTSVMPTEPMLAKGNAGPKVKSIRVSPASATIVIGQTVQLTATISPSSATAVIAWTSSNAAIATVSASGLV